MQELLTTWNMFFFLVLFGYLRVSFFGLFTMCDNRTGEIKYYVNYTNVYLEGKEVADWGNVSHVCILCPERGVSSLPLSKQFRTPTQSKAEDWLFRPSVYLCKHWWQPCAEIYHAFLFRFACCQSNQKLVGEQLENGFHMYSVFRNKIRSGRYF